jgi:hypothetical protein
MSEHSDSSLVHSDSPCIAAPQKRPRYSGARFTPIQDRRAVTLNSNRCTLPSPFGEMAGSHLTELQFEVSYTRVNALCMRSCSASGADVRLEIAYRSFLTRRRQFSVAEVS